MANIIENGQAVLIPYEDEEEGSEDKTNPKLQMSAEEGQMMETHTVEKGEWLSKIARDYGVSLDDIKKWNDIKDETIKPGQQLIVGIGTSNSRLKNNSKKGSLAQNKKTGDNKTINKSIAKNTLKTGVYTKDVEHTVEKGESLARLKEKYGVSMTAIREKNNLTSDNLKIGQKLIIPVKPGDNTNLAQNNPSQNQGGNTGSAVNAASKGNQGKADPLAQFSGNSGNSTPANNGNVDPLAQLSGNSGNSTPTNNGNVDPLAQLSGNTANNPNKNSFDNGLARGGNQGNVNNQGNNVNVLQGKYSFPKTHIVQRGESMDKLV
ncbi:MAG: LysM peptidoglycan-binding domain-containing protein, partial [Bacteroidota bacterium]